MSDASPAARTARLPLIDLLKAVAAQFIVLHHFSVYGPVSDAAHDFAPLLMDWLFNHARIAVQVFVVVAGYLAARGLSGGAWQKPLHAVAQRYTRLLGPYAAALLLAVACAALARPWLHDEFVPLAPSWGQLLAHVGLLHNFMGYDALSAGVWYIGIDFQLFLVLTLLLWLGRGPRLLTYLMVLLLCLLSLAWFNRDASYDNWAVYFFGAYGLGALAWWGRPSASGNAVVRQLYALAAVGAVVALGLDFRVRIALALLTSVLLLLGGESRREPPLAGLVHWLGQNSYALFLVHFPMLMLMNALFAHLQLHRPWEALAMIACGWALSLALAQLFYRQVEQRLLRWQRRFRGAPEVR